MTTSSTEATTERFEPPLLNDVQQEVVAALREHGIAVVRFQELFGEALWREAAADIAPFALEAGKALPRSGDVPASKHDIILRRFGVMSKKTAPVQLSLAGPWLQIAASELALDIVNAYRRQWTRLYYVDNWFTVPYPSVSERALSQRWHRDPEDEHVVKVFVYFSGVDKEAGPFEYIRDSTTGSRYGELWSWELNERYPPPDELEALIDQADHLTLTGPAGTMIFCDTGGFHRGGFARAQSRVLATFTYIGGDRKEGRRHFAVDFAGREQTLPPQVHFALTA